MTNPDLAALSEAATQGDKADRFFAESALQEELMRLWFAGNLVQINREGMTDTIESVSQAARDAAGAWCSAQPFPSKQIEGPAIIAGEYDHHSLVQAFARFERQIIASHTKALIEGARELGERLINGPYTVGAATGEIRELRQAAATISALRAENERLSAALHVIRRDVEVGIWCQSDIEWFVGEVLAGRQPDYLRALDAPVSGPLADSDGDDGA